MTMAHPLPDFLSFYVSTFQVSGFIQRLRHISNNIVDVFNPY